MNYNQEISVRSPGKKETSLRIPGIKAKDNDETCRLDSETEHFVVGQAARSRLEASNPRIDYEQSLSLIEGRLPRDKHGKVIPIPNALLYLNACFLDFRSCVVKYGEEILHTDGTVGYCKVYTPEELARMEQHAPLPRSDPLFDQLVGEILAKRRDA